MDNIMSEMSSENVSEKNLVESASLQQISNTGTHIRFIIFVKRKLSTNIKKSSVFFFVIKMKNCTIVETM